MKTRRRGHTGRAPGGDKRAVELARAAREMRAQRRNPIDTEEDET